MQCFNWYHSVQTKMFYPTSPKHATLVDYKVLEMRCSPLGAPRIAVNREFSYSSGPLKIHVVDQQ